MNLAIPLHKQEIVPLKVLKLAEYNPRSISPEMLEALKLQIRTNGLVQPIVARKEDGLVIGGHQRIAAVRALLEEQGTSEAGIESAPIPVVFLPGLDDAQAKLLNLALNKISGEWDSAKLSSVFESLNQDFNPGLVQLSGFSAEEVAQLLPSFEVPVLDAVEVPGLQTEKLQRFSFKLGSVEAPLLTRALEAFGMTSDEDAAQAFLNMARVALAAKAAASGTETVEVEL